MAPQTRTQRQAAAKKAAATRKRNSANQSSGTAKASARRTTTSAQSTGHAARTTAKQAARATARRASAETTRLEAVARQAERAILIPVGAALEVGDRVSATVRTYSDSRLTRQQLNRFERRGATALRRNRRALERQAKEVRDKVESRANGVQSSANDVVERVLEPGVSPSSQGRSEREARGTGPFVRSGTRSTIGLAVTAADQRSPIVASWSTSSFALIPLTCSTSNTAPPGGPRGSRG